MGSYTQLTQDQKYQIYGSIKAGFLQTSIASEIWVHKSTLSRELTISRGKNGYDVMYPYSNLIDPKSMKKATEGSLIVEAKSLNLFVQCPGFLVHGRQMFLSLFR